MDLVGDPVTPQFIISSMFSPAAPPAFKLYILIIDICIFVRLGGSDDRYLIYRPV
jgi:hypothetical protein